MKEWNDPRTMIPGRHFQAEKFFAWLKDNVDFPEAEPVD